VVNFTSRPLYSREGDTLPIVKKGGWAPGPVWTGEKNLALIRIRSQDRPGRSKALYRLSYSIPQHHDVKYQIMIYVVVYNLFFAISFGMKLSSSVEKCDKISVFSNPIHLWVLKTALSDGLGGLESKALSVDGQKVWLFMQLLVANCPYQK